MNKSIQLLSALLVLAAIKIDVHGSQEPWAKWARDPVTIPVTVVATNIQAATNSTVTISLADASVTQAARGCDSATETNAPPFVANLKVRRECLLTVVASNLTSMNLQLTFQPNWTPPARNHQDSRLKTYRLLTDRVLNPSGAISVNNPNWCDVYSNVWKIELNERLPANWRLDDGSNDPRPAPGDGKWAQIGPGKSLDKARAALEWSVSLGRLLDGTAAGRLTLRETALSPQIYTPTNLYFTAGSEVVRDAVQLITVAPTSPVLRQVKAFQAFADIVALTNNTEIRFYFPSQIGTATNGLGIYTNITGNPFVVWALSNPNPPNTNTLDIIERRNGGSSTNEIICDTNSGTATWTLRYGQGSDQRVETRGITFTTSPTTNRIETVDIRYSGAASPAYRAVETYRLFPWGFELVETRTDPDNNPGTANDLVNSFSFYQDSNAPESYTKPWVIVQPDGFWEKRLYDASDFYGALLYALHPDRDGLDANGSPLVPTNAQPTDCIVDSYIYDGDTGDFRGISTHYKDTVTNMFRFNLMVRDTGAEVNRSLDALSIPHTEEANGNFAGPTVDGGVWVGTDIETPDESKGLGYYGHDFFHHDDNGHPVDEVSYYHGGTYNPANYTFTANLGAVWGGPDWRRCTIYTGSPDPERASDPLFVYYAEGETLYSSAGQAVSVLYANRSWREAFIYHNGSLAQREMHILTGVDGFGEPQFDLVSKWVYQNDSLGHATNITWMDGASVASRVIYSADYRGAYTFDADLLLCETNENGIKTVYTHDTLKRPITSRKEGIVAGGGYPSQADITNSISYDAFGRILSQTTSASAFSCGSTTAYDLAGRVTSQTDTNGLTTSFVYDLGGRRITKTLPSGLTEVRETFLDRRLKSVTGTGVVNEFHDWNFLDEGTGAGAPLTHRVVTVHSTTLGATNSTRVIKEGIDWVGRVIRRETPDWAGTNGVIQHTGYFSYQLSQPNCFYRSVRSTQMPMWLNSYDFDGSTNLQSVPIEDTFARGWYEPDSKHRMSSSYWQFAKQGGNWFKFSTNWIYRVENDTNVTLASFSQERLNGFSSGNTLSEVTTWDADTNATVLTVTVDRAAKKITEVTDVPESTLNPTSVTVNGLLQSGSTATVAQPTRYGYDALGRQVGVTNTLGFVSITAYNSTAQVASVTDFTGLTTSYEYYSNGQVGAGQVKSMTLAGSQKTSYAYTNFGLWRVWGDAPYPEERLYSKFGELVELHTFRNGVGWNGPSWPASPGSPDKTTWSYHEPSGLLASKTDNSNKSVSFTYTNGLVFTRTWARGAIITNLYNDLGELVKNAYNDGTPVVAYTNAEVAGFSRSGLPQIVEDSTGTWRFEYDFANRLTATVCTNGNFNGISVSNRYDKVYGRDKIRITGPPTALQTTYGFDSSGRLASVTNGSSTAAYTYVANSDLLQATTCKSNATDSAAVLTTTRTWDFGTRLRSIQNTAGNASVSSHAYGYDGLDRRVSAALEDGSLWRYGYDDRNEVTSGRRFWIDWSPVTGQEFEYGYDTIGNRAFANSGGDTNGGNLRTTAYTVNALNQYTAISNPGYEDVCGIAWATNTVNVTNTTTGNGGAADRKFEYFHRELTIGNGTGSVWQNVSVSSGGTTNTGGLSFPAYSQTLTNDADGNLTFDGIWTYVWDAENRLKEMSMTNIANVPNAQRKQLKFTYDFRGRRATKKVHTWNGSAFSASSSADLKFVLDGWNVLAELDSANGNAPVRSYSWGLDLSGSVDFAGGIGGLLMVLDHSANPAPVHFPAYDGNGNVASLVRWDKTISARYEYGPFGEPIRLDGAFGKANPFRFSTKFADDESGLDYYGARLYSPNLGRWISRDPMAEGGGRNLLAFVDNDPTMVTDPLGLTGSGTALETEEATAIGEGVEGEGASQASNFLREVRSWSDEWNEYQKITSQMMKDVPEGDDLLMTVLRAGNKRIANAPVGGENAAAKLGRIAHKVYDMGNNYVHNRGIGGGMRPDATDFLNKIVRELKPFTESGIKKGGAQLAKYVKYLNDHFGPGWQGFLDSY